MATNLTRRGVPKEPSAALRQKCSCEFGKLKNKLEQKLKNDLNSCFESALYANLAIITKTVAIPLHTAILQARTPLFYKEITESCDYIPSRISILDAEPEKIRSLLRKIYTENNVEEEETILIALLRRARRLEKGDKVDNTTQPVTPTVTKTMDDKHKPTPDHENTINNNHKNNCTERRKCGSDGEDDHYSGQSEPFEMTNTYSATSSLFMSDINMGLTSDTDSGVHHDETATPKSNEGSSDGDKSHPLIRRDTFDLLDMAGSDEEDKNSTTVKDEINENEGQATVVWAIGGEEIRDDLKQALNPNANCETPTASPASGTSLEIISSVDENKIELSETSDCQLNLQRKDILKVMERNESPFSDISKIETDEMEEEIKIEDLPRKQSANIFSPDSIVSDRSPLLLNVEKDGGVFEFQRRLSSRKSSDSQSPEADSLNVEQLPFSSSSGIETVTEEHDVPIVSGFAEPIIESPKDDAEVTENKNQGSFFVFIDMNKIPEMKCEKPPVTRRRRAISFTAGEENFPVNNITLESLSDEEQSPQKSSMSVYMYIDAANASSKESLSSNKKVLPENKKKTEAGSATSSCKIGKTRHLRTLSLGQDLRLNLSTSTPEPPRAKDDMRLHELQHDDDDIETVYSDYTESGPDRSSSVVSPEGNDESDSRGPCSKLGDDLLRMFLDEINTDIIVNVNGREIKAHKCILSSRCSYFAAMLSGGWLESSGNIINLQGFSFTSVHFALCYIYSGATSLPKEVDIQELASLADMLGLEGLKDVVALTLKAKYCHFFHKPCPICINGVMECLMLCANYGLEELYDRALRWITRYMSYTWPTKPFAALPSDLLNKCYLAAKADVTIDSVLDTIMVCDKLMNTLPHVKWSEPVFGLSSKLLEACTVFMAKNFHAVLTSKNFLALGKGQSWNVNALEDTIMVALDSLTPDSACLSYATLDELLGCGEQSLMDPEVIENFIELLHKIQRRIERYLIHNANRVVQSPSWAKLSPTTQKRIKDAAVIVFEFGKPTAPPPRLSSLNRRFHRGKTHSPADHSESSTTSSSSGRLAGPKKQSRSVASKLTVTRPITAPIVPGSKSNPLQKKSPADNTQKNTTLKRSTSASINENAADLKSHSKPPPRVTDRTSADTGPAKLRKPGSRDRVANNIRPKSWPNKDKAQHPHPVKAQNKENAKETRISTATVPSRPNSKASAATRSSSGSLSRPKSACYSTETDSESTRPTRSATTSALRETKSSASKRVTHNDPDDASTKTKAPVSKMTRHSTLRKVKDDCKHDLPGTTNRRGVGIKAGAGNKG